MTPLTVPAIMLRACACWCGGKKSSMRLIDSVASTVWIVDSTRWPVSAADSAVWTVSSSRISPTRITSGSWRSTLRSARLNDAVSMPDLALVDHRALVAVHELDRVLDRDDVLAHRVVHVVDHRRERRRLARAGGAGQQHDPALLLGQFAHDRRAARAPRSCGCGAGSRGSHRDHAALLERVDAVARDVGDFEGEVDLVLLRELRQLGLVAEQRLAARPRCPLRSAAARSRRCVSSPWTRYSGAEPTFRCRSEPSFATSSRRAALTSNMP